MNYSLAILSFGIIFIITGCNRPITNLTYDNPDTRILFLHHSTGNNIWYGDVLQNKKKLFRHDTCLVPRLLKEYNESHSIKISIEEKNFPTGNPYPWQNDPYDYYNIWVKNAGDKMYMEEPTLEILTKKYKVIIFKHCFPSSNILEDDQSPDINSNKRTLANYRLQYEALKEKLYQFPQTRFIVWTGAALVESQTNEEEGRRANEFADWVKNRWDQPGDNISIFDFREIETEGGLFLKPEYASGNTDSHPNVILSVKAAKSLIEKITSINE